MNQGDWQPTKRIEEAYRSALKRLLDSFVSIVGPADISDPSGILSAFGSYLGSDVFSELARATASRMVTGLFHDNARDWREAARLGMRTPMVYEALSRELTGPVGDKVRAIVRENARLITSFGQMRVGKGPTFTEELTRFVQEETFKGRRSSAIAEDLIRKYPKATESRINLIARTETSKASTALTRARSENLGLGWYVWRSTKDARVRPAHWLMNRVIVPWAEAPAPEALRGVKSTLGAYHAGDCPNCRCYPEPLLRLDQVMWPCRVYHEGRLQPMTRVRFERISGMEVRRAA